MHLFISLVLGVVTGLVCSLFGMETAWAVLLGVIVFLAYWGIFVIIVDFDGF